MFDYPRLNLVFGMQQAKNPCAVPPRRRELILTKMCVCVCNVVKAIS